MASTAVALPRIAVKDDESEEDKELQAELKSLVDKITGNDIQLIQPAIDMMKYIIRTSTTSMTSVPKPLKYLAPHYDSLKDAHKKIQNEQMAKNIADIISLLAMGTAGGEEAKANRDCLKYCIQGTMENIGDWGHEYIRQLEKEIVQQWSFNCEKSCESLIPLVRDIMSFNCSHNAEIQGCDLLMEIDRLEMLPDYVAENNYQRICMYLYSCAKYVDEIERTKIMELVCEEYMNFEEFAKAMIIFIQIDARLSVRRIFNYCEDKVTLFQLAFICARHNYPVEIDPDHEYYDELIGILSNSYLSNYFLTLVRELDILDPKSPQDVYKTWLEPIPPRITILGEDLDSAKQNLASSFVNGFVNAGFGNDKLLTVPSGNKWIYRNKEHGMMSATASLGLLHLWDVDGGLTPIDRYLYSTDDYIKSGALLALGIVNCRVRNECDPALALLGDYVNSENEILQIGALTGLALAYAGSHREDVIDLLLPLVNTAESMEVLGITCLALGFISIGRSDNGIPSAIIGKIIELNNNELLKSSFMKLVGLGLSLCYLGAREDIEVTNEALSVMEEPFKTCTQTTLLMCAYAGTGDVLTIQELLRIVGEKVEIPEKKRKEKTEKKDKKEKTNSPDKPKETKKLKLDYSMGQAMATLAVGVVAIGEDIGIEMIHRIFGQVARYGEPSVRKAVPLAMALSSVSNPKLNICDVLTKYSHDSDPDVAVNAIFGLGIVGAGSNNARLAATLRQLAVFHNKNPSELFMVRIAQGLIHMGKGTMTFDPMHTDRMLMDPVGLVALVTVMVSLLEPQSLILGPCHYLLYLLSAAIQPRWLLTLDEDLRTLPVTVRVGQAVDTVGKAGTPKTIAGIHTHVTPVLLATAERAELATDEFEVVAPTLDGICVLKRVEEKPN
ncbi:26S proteasome non-ATPase regulatory subunit 2-like [Diorhabda carinulata]|uniref:26S proteasome non-ATPase regulatory subunit 2-like n=1 Tax=Diorhabda carinulata TaxID=1163345 RepID=UPI0025A09F19|nr:26S proteasome non-ATPase regulatory subunit 2-like [Diorhabda carinulata]